jgi:hypothetical protein
MAKHLHTELDLRRCREFPFCYICGRPFVKGDDVNLDHVPPKKAFSPKNRSRPLMLRTHKTCNKKQSSDDEKITQLLASLTGKITRLRDVKITTGLVISEDGKHQYDAVIIDLKHHMRRWLQGFHAALYRAPLHGSNVKYAIHPPFPEARSVSGSNIELKPLLSQQEEFCHKIRKNRAAGKTDSIRCFSGRCIYECVWGRLNDDEAISCFWALNVNEWIKMAPPDVGPMQGCVGVYTPQSGLPVGAAQETSLVLPSIERGCFDPFAE